MKKAMKKVAQKALLSWIATLGSVSTIYAQGSLTIKVKDGMTGEALFGATCAIENTNLGGLTDENGVAVINNIPRGKQTVKISLVGYNELRRNFEKTENDDTLNIGLQPINTQLDEIKVSSTRSDKSIADIPTRIEVLTGEIEEGMAMDPSRVQHVLTHSTGIQVQQTSAATGTANVRIQGLDGRYTQILMDGFPLYGGFSGSLSIMQIPPLDLRQIEYVKGAAATLYGGGAIAGLINLLTKTPGEDETILHLNASTTGAYDANFFVSRRYEKVGMTVMTSLHRQHPYDPDRDDFSDLPDVTKFAVQPRMFFYWGEKARLMTGVGLIHETRAGGDRERIADRILDSLHFYLERGRSVRVNPHLRFDYTLVPGQSLVVKNGWNIFDRSLNVTATPDLGEYRFSGLQWGSFTEVSYLFDKNGHSAVGGINLYSDRFKEHPRDETNLRNESAVTAGLFGQYQYSPTKWLTGELGFRGDYRFNDGFYPLPRISLLFKFAQKFGFRIGGGMGYRPATVFNQEAEQRGYRNVRPIDPKLAKTEKSYGANLDLGYKTGLGKRAFLSFNQMAFYTFLLRPSVFALGNDGYYYYYTPDGKYVYSRGTETQLKIGYGPWTLFVGYTFTDTRLVANDGAKSEEFTLTPRHSLKSDLLFHLPGRWRAAMDIEYKGRQKLANGTATPDLWIFGLMAQRTFGRFTIFVNAENITDRRQTRYQSLRQAPYGTPQFVEVWAPLDGFYFNGGIKITL
jgi:iron complex outermembrane receptor protein